MVMNIKLICPRMTLRPMDSEFKRRMSPSLSLMVLAALTSEEDTVVIEDENVRKISRNGLPDLVGITVNVDTSIRAYAIAFDYRRQGVPVILGGIHPSANPQEALQHGDAVCIGGAETVWPKILDDIRHGCLRKRYMDSEPADLALTPLPKRDLINASDYLYTNILSASRGCPFRCNFCYNSADYMRSGHRTRPIDHVLREIKELGTQQVMFIDDNFIGNPDWTLELLRAMTPLKLTWHAAVSTNLICRPDLLDAMQESGCRSLFIGFESINPSSLRSVNKIQNRLTQYDPLIRMLHEREIMVNASMVFGLDSDGPQVFADTLEWLVRNKVETVTAHILTPYPGTPLFERFLAEGRLLDMDWSHYNTSHVVYQPRHMSPQELRDGYLWFYKNFYSFSNILRRMPDSARLRVPYLLFNLGYRKFGKFTSLAAHLGLLNRMGKLARRLSYGID